MVAEISTKSIYNQNEKLEEQLTLWTLMNSRKRTAFVKEVRALVVSARQSERTTKTERAKNRLRNIIETWEEFLSTIENRTTEDFAVISVFDKTSATSTKNIAEEYSIIKFIRNIPLNISRLISQSLSINKFDTDTSVSIPHNPELRAIFDELYGTIDSTGDAK